jgi:hypothetical protein
VIAFLWNLKRMASSLDELKSGKSNEPSCGYDSGLSVKSCPALRPRSIKKISSTTWSTWRYVFAIYCPLRFSHIAGRDHAGYQFDRHSD